jgi:hypothetical protein
MPPTGERLEIERLTSRSERGRWKSTREGNSLTAYSTARGGFEAEVEGALYASTVTNSGPCGESTRKQSIDPLVPVASDDQLALVGYAVLRLVHL